MRHRAAELGDRCASTCRADTYREALAEVDGPLQVVQPTSRALRCRRRALAERREVEMLPARGFVTDTRGLHPWAEGRGGSGC